MSAAKIAYSPAYSVDLTTVDVPSLQSLKYHQLLKLANQHNVMKRWAKKEDLITSLMAAKSKLVSNTSDEWKDGEEVFSQMTSNTKNDKENAPARLTFVVDKAPLDDSRATFSLPGTSFPNLAFKAIDPRLTFNVTNDETKIVELKKSSRLHLKNKSIMSARRTVDKLSDSPSINKLSMRSITIKKDSTRSPLKTMKSFRGEIRPNVSVKVPIPKTNNAIITPNPTAVNSIIRRKSKSDDPGAGRRSLVKPTFHSPPTTSVTKQIDSAKIVKTKLPNFTALHQRQFDKMDSLDDYIRKKSERVKNLFATPTHRSISKVNNSSPLPSKSQARNKEGVVNKTPSKKQLDAAKIIINKNPQLRTRTDVKDKTRSHIHGFRTNKRFELQMKFRNF